MKLKYIILIFIVLISHAAFSPEISAQQGSGVTITVNPDTLLPGIPFNLTFLINYPDPEEVTIISPPFPRDFIMDRIVKHPQSIGLQIPEIFTLVEYRIITYTSGTFTLGSFEIQTPEGVTETGAFNLTVRSPAPAQRYTTHSLRWDLPLSPITAGDRVTLTLRANNWNSQQPPASFFMPQVPQGVILSALSVSPAERYEGVILKIQFIPLSAGTFSLPGRVLEHDTVRFEIPLLNLNVISKN